MKRVIMVIGAGSAALAALARRTAETVGEIRDLASGGPSIEVCPECMRVYDPKPFGGCGHCQREPAPVVAHAGGSSQALAARIRSVLGNRNDDSRTVVDLIDELCEELDRREPSVICGCGAFNGPRRSDCCECGKPLTAASICPRCNGRGNFPRNEGRPYKCLNCDGTGRAAPDRIKGPCGLCDGVGIVDIGFGQTDTCGGCKGTGRAKK